MGLTIRALIAVAALVVTTSVGCGPGGSDEVDRGSAEQAASPMTTADTASESNTDGRSDTDDASTQLGTTRDFTQPDLSRDVVLFDFEQHELRPDAAALLSRIAPTIAYFQGAGVHVVGHTDSHGSDNYNQRLSENRAQSVVDYLIGAGVDADRITAEAFGETQPVAPNEKTDGSDNAQGRAQNRRVEIGIQGVAPDRAPSTTATRTWHRCWPHPVASSATTRTCRRHEHTALLPAVEAGAKIVLVLVRRLPSQLRRSSASAPR